MPTYEYRCTECGERTEAFQRMSDAPLKLCPACHKEGLQRLVSGGAGVLYKGEGWYVTDYSKKSSGGKDAPPDPKPDATSTKSSDAAASTTADSGAKSTDTAGSSTTALPKTGT